VYCCLPTPKNLNAINHKCLDSIEKDLGGERCRIQFDKCYHVSFKVSEISFLFQVGIFVVHNFRGKISV
jgi:hypothetical protein